MTQDETKADELHNRATLIVHEALERTPDERKAYVKAACGDDARLLEYVKMALSATGGEIQSPIDIDGLEASVKAQLFPLPSIEGFTLQKWIGEGAQGTVYKAVQNGTKAEVAIKVFDPSSLESNSALTRFLNEASTIARVKQSWHPGNNNIITVYQTGATSDGRPFYAMEYIKTPQNERTLDAYVRSRKLSLQSLLTLFIGACRGVDAMHQQGVIHRDIKPSNILIKNPGSNAIAVLVDFGLAKNLSSKTRSTRTGAALGTPRYMSPEQVRGEDHTRASDTYCMGVVLCELLTGRLPYDNNEAGGPKCPLEMRVLQTAPVAPSQILKQRMLAGRPADEVENWPCFNIDRDLDAVVLKALEKDPSERYSGAENLADDLQRYLDGEPLAAKPPTIRYLVRKWAKRNWIPLAAACVGMILLSRSLVSSYREKQMNRLARDVVQFVANDMSTVIDRQERTSKAFTLPAFLDVLGDSIEQRTWEHHQAEEAMRYMLGRLFLSTGMFAEAETQLSAVRASVASRDRTDSSLAMAAESALVIAMLEQQKHEEGTKLARKVAAKWHALDVDRRLSTYMCGLPNFLATPRKFVAEQGSHGNQEKAAIAEEILRQRLRDERTQMGLAHPDAVRTMFDLARALHVQGKRKESLLFLKDAAAISRRPGFPKTARMASGMLRLGDYLMWEGEYQRAQQLFKETIAIAEGLPDHRLSKQRALVFLASACLTVGDLNSAQAASEQALELILDTLPKARPSRFDALTHRGLSYVQRLELGMEAANILSKTREVGGGQPELEDTWAQLEQLASSMLNTQREQLPAKDPLLARTLQTHGRCLMALNRFAEAEAAWREAEAALRVSERIAQSGGSLRNPDIPEEAIEWSDEVRRCAIADCLLAQEKYSQAEQILMTLPSLQSRNHRTPLSQKHEPVTQAGMGFRVSGQYYRLGNCYLGRQDYPAAEHAFDVALHYLEASTVSQATSWHRGLVLQGLGESLCGQGRHAEAERVLWESIAIERELLPENHPGDQYTQMLLGESLLGQNRRDEAESGLRTAWDVVKPDTSIRLGAKRRILQRVISIHQSDGRNEAAAEWEAKLAELGNSEH